MNRTELYTLSGPLTLYSDHLLEFIVPGGPVHAISYTFEVIKTDSPGRADTRLISGLDDKARTLMYLDDSGCTTAQSYTIQYFDLPHYSAPAVEMGCTKIFSPAPIKVVEHVVAGSKPSTSPRLWYIVNVFRGHAPSKRAAFTQVRCGDTVLDRPSTLTLSGRIPKDFITTLTTHLKFPTGWRATFLNAPPRIRSDETDAHRCRYYYGGSAVCDSNCDSGVSIDSL